MIRAHCTAWMAMLLLSGCALLSGSQRSGVLKVRKALAHDLIQREDWPAAFRVVDALCKDHPRDAEALAMRGVIYREQDLRAESEADLSDAIREDANLAYAHAAIAVLYDLEGKPEEAETHHRRAVELEPNSAEHLNNLGFSLFVHGRAREAIEIYLRGLRIEPTNRRLRNNLGFAYAKIGDLPRAAHQFALGGTAPEAKINLGYAYEKRGNLAQAFELYLEAARLDPASRRARMNLEDVAKRLGKPLPPDVTSPPERADPAKGQS